MVSVTAVKGKKHYEIGNLFNEETFLGAAGKKRMKILAQYNILYGKKKIEFIKKMISN